MLSQPVQNQIRHYIQRHYTVTKLMKNSFLVLSGTILLLTGSTLLTGCKQTPDAVAPATTVATTGNQTVDGWILSNMRDVYYWNDKIPANPDTTTAPDVFFNSILYKYDQTLRPDGDRFSWIENNATQLKAELSGQSKTTGMEFNLYYRGQSKTGLATVDWRRFLGSFSTIHSQRIQDRPRRLRS